MLAVHRSERADRLIEALGDLLSVPLPDPIAAEVVSVPTRGVERWLTQRLSHRLGAPLGGGGGVCANIRFPFPGTLVGHAMAAVSDVDPADDPWRPERCVWPLVELIDRHCEDPHLAALYAHLRAATPDDRQGRPGSMRRFATARHLADLFDHYAVHRPDLVMAWTRGEAPGGAPSDPTPRWQAYLWQLLRASLGVPSPAERFEQTAQRLVDQPELLDLPERLSLFGLTRLPASHLQVLHAVAQARDVHLFLLHPSGRLWDAVGAAAPGPPGVQTRAQDPTARLAQNPLLRSWGRDSREMQLVLAAQGISGGQYRPVDIDSTGAPLTLLGRLQADIRADRRPPGTPVGAARDQRGELDLTDMSVQVHACHGRSRQVEVLRDAVLHLLAIDPTLEARDVIVMCPDIETFAPLVHAAFGGDDLRGAGGSGDGSSGNASEDSERDADGGVPRLRVRLADRSLRQTNPLLAVAAQVLVLAGARVTASEVLDLVSRPPVARRFRFDQDDLSTLERWVAGTGIRWGLDAAHREPWALQEVTANTWASGLDRLLLGAAMAEDDCRTFGGAVPYDDVPSSAVELAGRTAELVGRVRVALDSLGGRQPIDAWIDALVNATELLAVAAPSDDWQHEQLRRVLSEVADEAAPSGNAASSAGRSGRPDLSLDEVRSLLDTRLKGRPTRANFRTGDLTICTLVPMRSVPHRVVALLGLDDGAFPRHPETDGDDLLLAEPRVGDRDARSEDRQLLLDALLAATDHLIVTYSGRDERTNRPRPPAVPVAELLDALDATVRRSDGAPARRQVLIQHPLQPFDARNFTAGELAGQGPWSYDRVHLAGARAAADQRPPARWLSAPLPRVDEPVIQLDYVVNFVEHPTRAFLRRRLGLYLSDRSDQLLDALPLELDALERWGVGDRLVDAVLAGTDPERALMAERGRGLLPPGALADSVLSGIESDVNALGRAITALGFEPGPADSLDVRVDLPDGRTLIGTVPNLRGDSLLVCTFSRLAAKHRLAAWVRFLAVSAARPELAVTALTVGRGRGHQPPQVSRLDPLGATPGERRERALAELTAVVELYDRGMCSPLPLVCATSAAWADARNRANSEEESAQAADDAWRDGLFPGETSDIEHRYVWGGRVRLDQLQHEIPGPTERGPGWPDTETSRFGVLARRLWDPILAHEQLGSAR